MNEPQIRAFGVVQIARKIDTAWTIDGKEFGLVPTGLLLELHAALKAFEASLPKAADIVGILSTSDNRTLGGQG